MYIFYYYLFKQILQPSSVCGFSFYNDSKSLSKRIMCLGFGVLGHSISQTLSFQNVSVIVNN